MTERTQTPQWLQDIEAGQTVIIANGSVGTDVVWCAATVESTGRKWLHIRAIDPPPYHFGYYFGSGRKSPIRFSKSDGMASLTRQPSRFHLLPATRARMKIAQDHTTAREYRTRVFSATTWLGGGDMETWPLPLLKEAAEAMESLAKRSKGQAPRPSTPY